jgi:predicted ATPase
LDQLGDRITPATRAPVIDASEGNPLFLEEMVALAREHDSVMVPSTIHALLAACLEQLEREDREVLERAAIEGEVFHKELICPHQPTSMGDRAFRFRHLLIRDAAYDALPKAIRAELHARFANWPEVNASELAELDEITGWHLEQTIRHRQELRHYPDPALAHRAAQHLHQAGRHAARRGDTTLPGTSSNAHTQ